LPALSLEEVYGAIAFYLANLPEVEATLVEDEVDLERLRLAAREKHPLFFKKLDEARRSVAVQGQLMTWF
jgi:hypothetical protein